LGEEAKEEEGGRRRRTRGARWRRGAKLRGRRNGGRVEQGRKDAARGTWEGWKTRRIGLGWVNTERAESYTLRLG